jgi:hypothetical protein
LDHIFREKLEILVKDACAISLKIKVVLRHLLCITSKKKKKKFPVTFYLSLTENSLTSLLQKTSPVRGTTAPSSQPFFPCFSLLISSSSSCCCLFGSLIYLFGALSAFSEVRSMSNSTSNSIVTGSQLVLASHCHLLPLIYKLCEVLGFNFFKISFVNFKKSHTHKRTTCNVFKINLS